MWVAGGEYKKGDLYALVRAKDDSFKFDTRATGKTAELHGFAVAKLLDYCAERGELKAGSNDKCATPVESGNGKGKCSTKTAADMEITFFATEVKYIDR